MQFSETILVCYTGLRLKKESYNTGVIIFIIVWLAKIIKKTHYSGKSSNFYNT